VSESHGFFLFYLFAVLCSTDALFIKTGLTFIIIVHCYFEANSVSKPCFSCKIYGYQCNTHR